MIDLAPGQVWTPRSPRLVYLARRIEASAPFVVYARHGATYTTGVAAFCAWIRNNAATVSEGQA